MSEEKERQIIDEVVETVTDFVENRTELVRLIAIEKASKIAGVIAMMSVLALTALLALLFISFMASYYFSAHFGSRTLGFGVTGLIYVIFIFFLYPLRNRLIKKPVTNFFVRTLSEPTDLDETE